VWEYPLALVAACLVKPATPDDARRDLAWDIILPLALLAWAVLIRRVLLTVNNEGSGFHVLASVLGYGLPGLALMIFSTRRWRFALGIALFLFAPVVAQWGETIAIYRSFFGVYRVTVTDDGSARLLAHGTTLHGAESLLPGEENLPLTYYSHEGPFGRFFATVAPNSVRHVAVVGLGTGALACYAQPGQDWTFYEIDPLIERIAHDPRYFHFLANCGNLPRVVFGDARLAIASAPDGTYDVLILDAFSSDSIPMHLLRWRSICSALAGHGGELSRLGPADGWAVLPPVGARSLWTDQRSDLLRATRLRF
jgi:hypothetical protein